MNLRQFLLTNRKDKEGRTNLWPPIGDLCMVAIGTAYYWLQTDATYLIGIPIIMIGVICFGLSYVKYVKHNLGDVKHE